MKRVILILCILAIAFYFFLPEKKITFGPGQVAPDPPVQKRLLNAQPKNTNGYLVKPLAQFNMQARVLSIRKYYFGQESRVSPMDAVFGWGPMSDERVLDDISISQHGRWYFWRSNDLPIPKADIQIHSANMHLIPATDNIKKTMKQMRIGHVVNLKGKQIGRAHV